MKKDQKKTITGPIKQEPEIREPKPQSEVDRAIQKLREQKETKDQKRGRGRPRKESPVQEPVPDIQSGVLFKAVFMIIAARLGPHWLLTPDEIKQIDEAGNLILKKYAPKMMSYLPELYFGSVLIAIFGSKVQAHKVFLAKHVRRVEPAKAESVYPGQFDSKTKPVKDETKDKTK